MCYVSHNTSTDITIKRSYVYSMLFLFRLYSCTLLSLSDSRDLGVSLREVLLRVLGVDSILTRVPVGGAHLAVLLRELESVNKAEGLIDRAADRKIVDGDLSPDVSFDSVSVLKAFASYLADNALGVNDEDTPQRNTLLLNQDTVVPGELVVLVREQGELDLAKTTVLAGGGRPREERVLAVDGRKDDFGTTLLELGDGVGVGNDLSGAE